MLNLAHSKLPNDLWSAYYDCCQKAVEDYGKELATMNRLLVGVTKKMGAATQPTTEYADRNDLFSRRELLRRGGISGLLASAVASQKSVRV